MKYKIILLLVLILLPSLAFSGDISGFITVEKKGSDKKRIKEPFELRIEVIEEKPEKIIGGYVYTMKVYVLFVKDSIFFGNIKEIGKFKLIIKYGSKIPYPSTEISSFSNATEYFFLLKEMDDGHYKIIRE